jgi:hypothetical protein
MPQSPGSRAGSFVASSQSSQSRAGSHKPLDPLPHPPQLVDKYLAAHGPFFGGAKLNALDASMAPKMYHLQVALKHFKVGACCRLLASGSAAGCIAAAHGRALGQQARRRGARRCQQAPPAAAASLSPGSPAHIPATCCPAPLHPPQKWELPASLAAVRKYLDSVKATQEFKNTDYGTDAIIAGWNRHLGH